MIGTLVTAAKGANPAGALFSLLWRPLLVLALVCLFYLWAHHRGYESGFAKGTADLNAVQGQLATVRADKAIAIGANESLAQSEAALRKANAELAAQNENLTRQGVDALNRESARAAAAEKVAADWRKRYEAESRKAPCAAAKAELARACAALKDYY